MTNLGDHAPTIYCHIWYVRQFEDIQKQYLCGFISLGSRLCGMLGNLGNIFTWCMKQEGLDLKC
jgi:hypothetical protein